jgi:hypothetical protein
MKGSLTRKTVANYGLSQNRNPTDTSACCHKSCTLQHTLPAPRRFSHLPEILIFMMPEPIHQAIIRIHFETKVIRFPPGFQDGANLDLVLVQHKRDGSLICPGAIKAPDRGTIPRFQQSLRHALPRFSLRALLNHQKRDQPERSPLNQMFVDCSRQSAPSCNDTEQSPPT